jgi:ribokinase
VEPSGQNRILVVKGANDLLKPADVEAAADLLKTVDCMVMQFEIPIETVYYCVSFAKKHGIRCIVNPAPAGPVDMSALAGLDYFVPNESEAETITGMPVRTPGRCETMRGQIALRRDRTSNSDAGWRTVRCWPTGKQWSISPRSA